MPRTLIIATVMMMQTLETLRTLKIVPTKMKIFCFYSRKSYLLVIVVKNLMMKMRSCFYSASVLPNTRSQPTMGSLHGESKSEDKENINRKHTGCVVARECFIILFDVRESPLTHGNRKDQRNGRT